MPKITREKNPNKGLVNRFPESMTKEKLSVFDNMKGKSALKKMQDRVKQEEDEDPGPPLSKQEINILKKFEEEYKNDINIFQLSFDYLSRADLIESYELLDTESTFGFLLKLTLKHNIVNYNTNIIALKLSFRCPTRDRSEDRNIVILKKVRRCVMHTIDTEAKTHKDIYEKSNSCKPSSCPAIFSNFSFTDSGSATPRHFTSFFLNKEKKISCNAITEQFMTELSSLAKDTDLVFDIILMQFINGNILYSKFKSEFDEKQNAKQNQLIALQLNPDIFADIIRHFFKIVFIGYFHTDCAITNIMIENVINEETKASEKRVYIIDYGQCLTIGAVNSEIFEVDYDSWHRSEKEKNAPTIDGVIAYNDGLSKKIFRNCYEHIPTQPNLPKLREFVQSCEYMLAEINKAAFMPYRANWYYDYLLNCRPNRPSDDPALWNYVWLSALTKLHADVSNEYCTSFNEIKRDLGFLPLVAIVDTEAPQTPQPQLKQPGWLLGWRRGGRRIKSKRRTKTTRKIKSKRRTKSKRRHTSRK